jgi:hypothetical protein
MWPCPEQPQAVDQGHVEAEDRRAQRTRQRRDSGLVPVLLVMGTLAAAGEQFERVDAAPGDRVALHDEPAGAAVAVIFGQNVKSSRLAVNSRRSGIS